MKGKGLAKNSVLADRAASSTAATRICLGGGAVTFPVYLCGLVLRGTPCLSSVDVLLFIGTDGPLFQKPRMTPV